MRGARRLSAAVNARSVYYSCLQASMAMSPRAAAVLHILPERLPDRDETLGTLYIYCLMTPCMKAKGQWKPLLVLRVLHRGLIGVLCCVTGAAA